MEIKDLYAKCRERYCDTHLKELETNGTYSEQNKNNLKAFSIDLLSTGRTGTFRAGKLLSQLKPISLMLGKDFREATLLDMQKLLVKINEMPKSDATRADYRRALKQFYLWFEEYDERLANSDFMVREEAKKLYKFLNKKVRTSYKRKEIDPNEIINDEDLKLLIEKGCTNSQEEAIIRLLHEIGCRTNGLLLTKKNGFTVDERGIGTIYLGDGKSGPRSIDIITSVPAIQKHLINHPLNDSNAPLFYWKHTRRKKAEISPFTHSRFYILIKRIFKRAGLSKKSNPHWFRHSRASLDTIDGSMSELVRKKRMGWSDNSKMIANYSHLGQKEVRLAWMKAKGIQDENIRKEEFITCICKRTISSFLSYCPHCGRPTSLRVVEKEKLQAKEIENQITEILPLVPSNPRTRKEFFEVIKYAMEIKNNPKIMEEFEEFKRS